MSPIVSCVHRILLLAYNEISLSIPHVMLVLTRLRPHSFLTPVSFLSLGYTHCLPNPDLCARDLSPRPRSRRTSPLAQSTNDINCWYLVREGAPFSAPSAPTSAICKVREDCGKNKSAFDEMLGEYNESRSKYQFNSLFRYH